MSMWTRERLRALPLASLQAHLERAQREADELDAACSREGGFLTSDVRVLRMRSLADELDELEEEWYEREYLHAHEDDDDLDDI